MKLAQEAIKMIVDGITTSDDIIKLEQIKAELAYLYLEKSKEASGVEQAYNMSREQLFIDFKARKRSDGKPPSDGQASSIAKAEAEKEYGHYRSLNAEAKGIKVIIDTISTNVIAFQSNRKREGQTEYSANMEKQGKQN